MKKSTSRLLHNSIIFLFMAIMMAVPCSLFAQDKSVMIAIQNELTPLLDKIYNAPTDNERYNANDQFEQLLGEALTVDNSFAFQWDFKDKVSVLTSSDRQFRIFTWPVRRDDGAIECFGYVQSWNEKTEEYDVYELNDMSDEIISADESVLSPENWLGCVYQTLIESKYDGHTYYTLLGWTMVDPMVQRQVIEPICFRQTSSKPQFGQNLFRRDKNRRRVLFEYSGSVMINVRYDEQFVNIEEVKKVKNKKTGRMMNVRETHQEKMKMILFDQIAPAIPGMEGLPQYYVPTGTEEAYIFNEGKWELRDSAQGRSDNPKLNKEFSPIDKKAPAYKVTNAQD